MQDNAISIEALLRSSVRHHCGQRGVSDSAWHRRGPPGIFNADCTVASTTVADNVLPQMMPPRCWRTSSGLAGRSGRFGWHIRASWKTCQRWSRLHEHHPAQRFPGREHGNLVGLLTYPIILSEHMPQPNYDDVLLAGFNAYKLWGAGRVAD